MNRTQKEEVIADLRVDFSGVQGAVLAEYQGMSVREISEIRRAFGSANVKVKVLKNRLARIAAEGTPLEVISQDFVGPVALAYSLEDPVSPAKIADEWADKQDKFILKCGYVDNTRIDLNGISALAKLPGPDELRSKLLNVMLAPGTQLVRTLNAVPQQVALLLNAYSQKLGEGE